MLPTVGRGMLVMATSAEKAYVSLRLTLAHACVTRADAVRVATGAANAGHCW